MGVHDSKKGTDTHVKSWLKFAKSIELLRCMMMAILVIATEFERRMVERRERTSVSLRTKRTDPQRWTMIPRRGRGRRVRSCQPKTRTFAFARKGKVGLVM